jgi:cob(I)alamin adenosyltransferase
MGVLKWIAKNPIHAIGLILIVVYNIVCLKLKIYSKGREPDHINKIQGWYTYVMGIFSLVESIIGLVKQAKSNAERDDEIEELHEDLFEQYGEIADLKYEIKFLKTQNLKEKLANQFEAIFNALNSVLIQLRAFEEKNLQVLRYPPRVMIRKMITVADTLKIRTNTLRYQNNQLIVLAGTSSARLNDLTTSLKTLASQLKPSISWMKKLKGFTLQLMFPNIEHDLLMRRVTDLESEIIGSLPGSHI